MDILENLLALNEYVMGVFLSDSFAVHEYVILLPQHVCESLQVNALILDSVGEEL